MKVQLLSTLVFATVMAFTASPVFSEEPEKIYGSQLMTNQERIEHRERLRNAKTMKEREKIRKDHHERMKERAREQGKSLPDEPPARGGFMGSGDGPQDGSGSGRGGGGR